MELLLIWLAFSALAGFIAHGKGRFGLGFFLLAALLSPLVGVIAALAVGRDQDVLDARAIAARLAIKCPWCAEVVRPDAKLCKHCGRDLTVQPPVDPPPAPVPPPFTSERREQSARRVRQNVVFALALLVLLGALIAYTVAILP